jgi:5-methylcytosine-specific restriction enzyme subunit McrC
MSVTHPIYQISEWESRFIADATFAREDRCLVEQLSKGDSLRIDEIRGGIRINARASVGVLRFSNFGIHIIPKLTGENVGLIKLLDYTSGVDALERFESHLHLLTGNPDLVDLMAWLLAEAVEIIVQHGLLVDYCEREDDLPVLRGRLLIAKQTLKRFGKIDRLECRFDEQLTDIPENQILAAAIAVCTRTVRHLGILRKIRRLRSIFEAACDYKGVDLSSIRNTLTYHRLNEVYREAHQLAWLILDAIGVEAIYREGQTKCFAFLLDMNRLFEKFVSKWVKQLLYNTACEVRVQVRDRSVLWQPERGRHYAAVIPDLLIEAPGSSGRLPVDAKYKLYDTSSVDSSDLYQAFLYAFAFGRDSTRNPPRAILIYPSSQVSSSSWRIQVRSIHRTIGGEITVRGIHIPIAVAEARRGSIGPLGQELYIDLTQGHPVPQR